MIDICFLLMGISIFACVRSYLQIRYLDEIFPVGNQPEHLIELTPLSFPLWAALNRNHLFFSSNLINPSVSQMVSNPVEQE